MRRAACSWPSLALVLGLLAGPALAQANANLALNPNLPADRAEWLEADVFEALTAGDRPYKKGKTLAEATERFRKLGKARAMI